MSLHCCCWRTDIERMISIPSVKSRLLAEGRMVEIQRVIPMVGILKMRNTGYKNLAPNAQHDQGTMSKPMLTLKLAIARMMVSGIASS